MRSLVITISLGFLLSSIAAVPVISPADVRFARYRCQESTTTNETLRSLWRSGTLPNENQTHCFVKCVLGRLGLIDLKDRGLDGIKICDHFGITEPYRTMVKYWLKPPLNGTCASYFEKWMQMREYFLKDANYIFYDAAENQPGDDKTVVNCDIGKVSAITACIENLIANWTLSDVECQHFCIFKHFHFFDAYGRVDQSEIVRSFHEAQESLKGYEGKLHQCVHFANSLFSYGPCRMAVELKLCLLKELPKAVYAFDHRNKILRYL